jgi:hypothetical protein
MMNDKKQMLSERSVMFSGDTMVTEGWLTDVGRQIAGSIDMNFTGRADRLVAYYEDKAANLQSEGERKSILKDIQQAKEWLDGERARAHGHVSGDDAMQAGSNIASSAARGARIGLDAANRQGSSLGKGAAGGAIGGIIASILVEFLTYLIRRKWASVNEQRGAFKASEKLLNHIEQKIKNAPIRRGKKKTMLEVLI